MSEDGVVRLAPHVDRLVIWAGVDPVQFLRRQDVGSGAIPPGLDEREGIPDELARVEGDVLHIRIRVRGLGRIEHADSARNCGTGRIPPGLPW